MGQSYRDLIAWQKAIELVAASTGLPEHFPLMEVETQVTIAAVLGYLSRDKETTLLGHEPARRVQRGILVHPAFFSIFAQVSLSATVRLNTGLPGAESGSAQKYPRRSNW